MRILLYILWICLLFKSINVSFIKTVFAQHERFGILIIYSEISSVHQVFIACVKANTWQLDNLMFSACHESKVKQDMDWHFVSCHQARDASLLFRLPLSALGGLYCGISH